MNGNDFVFIRLQITGPLLVLKRLYLRHHRGLQMMFKKVLTWLVGLLSLVGSTLSATDYCHRFTLNIDLLLIMRPVSA